MKAFTPVSLIAGLVRGMTDHSMRRAWARRTARGPVRSAPNPSEAG